MCLIHVRCVKYTAGISTKVPSKQPPIHPSQHANAARELDHRPPGVVHHAEDQIAHAAGVFAEDAGHAAGFQFIHPMQRQPHGVGKRPPANIHLHAFGGGRGVPSAPQMNRGFHHRNPKAAKVMNSNKFHRVREHGHPSGEPLGRGFIT